MSSIVVSYLFIVLSSFYCAFISMFEAHFVAQYWPNGRPKTRPNAVQYADPREAAQQPNRSSFSRAQLRSTPHPQSNSRKAQVPSFPNRADTTSALLSSRKLHAQSHAPSAQSAQAPFQRRPACCLPHVRPTISRPAWPPRAPSTQSIRPWLPSRSRHRSAWL